MLVQDATKMFEICRLLFTFLAWVRYLLTTFGQESTAWEDLGHHDHIIVSVQKKDLQALKAEL